MNEKTIKSIEKKIINSPEFAGSKINRDLLVLLIQSYLKGEIPKETTIAIEVFGRDIDFNPNEDTIVRVHMHTLRNKLDSYYKSGGEDDKIRLEIPKGHYALQFVSVPERKNKITVKVPSSSRFYLLVVIFVLCAMVIYLWNRNSATEKKLQHYQVLDVDNPIWKEYLQSNLQTLIVLGNHLFFSEYSEDLQRWRYIRDVTINSFDNMDLLTQQFPEKKIKRTNEAYFPDGSIWSLPPILSVLYSANKNAVLKRVADITPQTLREGNILFLGSIKTLGLFDRYILGSHFSYKLQPNTIFFVPPDGDIINTNSANKLYYSNMDSSKIDTLETYFNNSTGYHRDLSLALKFPGPNNNVILIITSFFSSGAPEVAKYLTNPTSLAELDDKFMEKYGKIPRYFEILFEVRGVVKTGFYLEIKYLNEISEDVKVW